jgi:hypothetical protein
MDFSMTDGPPASHDENYVHSWLQDTVAARQILLDKIVCFAFLDFGGAHAAFHLMMITCAVRRYGFLLLTLLNHANTVSVEDNLRKRSYNHSPANGTVTATTSL